MILRPFCAVAVALALPAAVLAHGEHGADAGDAHGHAHDAASRRELGAHVHGEGALSIAIDGGVIEMVFEAPGADIVGFEHPAESDADRAAVAEAERLLSDPLALFVPPAAAECRTRAATVALVGEHDDHGDDHDHDHGADHAGHAAAEAGGHSAFEAAYTLNCAHPERIDAIDFRYFATFPNARALDVAIASERGQSAHEVTRDAPALTLGGGI